MFDNRLADELFVHFSVQIAFLKEIVDDFFREFASLSRFDRLLEGQPGFQIVSTSLVEVPLQVP